MSEANGRAGRRRGPEGAWGTGGPAGTGGAGEPDGATGTAGPTDAAGAAGAASADGPVCPGCGTPRPPWAAPSCGCAREAADAALETRSAEAAAAEDFDPIRIRPYVTLPEPSAPLPALSSAPLPPQLPQGTDSGATEAASGPERSARRGRGALYAGAGLVVAAAAVFTGGVMSGDAGDGAGGDGGGGRDRALPDLADGTPDRTAKEPAPRDAPGAAPAPSASAHPRSSPTRTPSATAPRSVPVRTSVRESPAPSPSRTTARATGSVGPPPSRTPSAAPTLRSGDRGPEVAELQRRLRQLYLYVGPLDGHYTPPVTDAVSRYQGARGIRTDPQGTYGPATRRSLESETDPS
ncbi:peptidoglycan-binding domain-containing protein [Streptomyces flavofungini]|uniref:peptidoglycan-binding domain-containing protein n=1 Tax=Streptomyces flavofungini TaxID=68200 RepID=UPI0025AF8007|nr:peptidoglycan-binding domain-containing protein [Streptomyces flavofungini]WJV49062.1 peptidoglycan-binding domain-containing protein [Streptomyces flavofungini]